PDAVLGRAAHLLRPAGPSAAAHAARAVQDRADRARRVAALYAGRGGRERDHRAVPHSVVAIPGNGRGQHDELVGVTEALNWWRTATAYQIYVRSFADSNGDGVGDLEGIRSRLDYLRDLGVDAVWLTPLYRSPMVDNGYDVADPRDVDPLFGDLGAFDRLLADAHERGIKVTVDVVPNHTSSQHPWFQAALASPPGSPERARYWFRDGKGDDGEQPPNNWLSCFTGPAWTRVADGQWYLHLFAPEQPDLNWANPEVVADFHKTLRFWLDRGVDGFRIDVAHGMSKPADLPDMDPRAMYNVVEHATYPDLRLNHVGVFELHEGIRRVLDEYPGTAAIGEVWTFDDEQMGQYIAPGRLHLGFN